MKKKQEQNSGKRQGVSRRGFLAGAAAGGISMFLAGCTSAQREALFRKRFKELSHDAE